MTLLSHTGIKADGESPSSTIRPAQDVEKEPDEKQLSPTQTTSLEKHVLDPNLVGWDGDDDPKKPQNWSTKKKWQSAGLIAAMTFLT